VAAGCLAVLGWPRLQPLLQQLLGLQLLLQQQPALASGTACM
jgi:hypothetical protein